MRTKRLLERLARGSLRNVAFSDFISLVKACGFQLVLTSGSHQIFVHPDISELLNVQNVGGQAKPYQIRQFLPLVERYNLKLEEDQ